MFTLEEHQDICKLINACREGADNTTPIPLVREMIDKVPKEIWKDKSAKILDPAAGSGSYLVAAYWKMIEAGDTHDNILNNRLYGCETDLVYIKFLREKLGLRGKKLRTKDFLKLKLNNMKFDVIIGNPPFNDDSTTQSTGRRRTGRMYLDFIYRSAELSKKHVLMISPARGWIIGTRREKYLKEFMQLGLQSLHNCDAFFNIKIQDVIYLHLDKSNVLSELIVDETESKFKPVENNLGELYVRSMSEKRGILESINDKDGSLVYLTTSRTTTIADTSLINDKYSGHWRVIFNVNGSKDSIGKVLVIPPGTYVSYSVCYLLAKDENDANRIKDILLSNSTVEIMKNVRVSASNTKYHFSFIENKI